MGKGLSPLLYVFYKDSGEVMGSRALMPYNSALIGAHVCTGPSIGHHKQDMDPNFKELKICEPERVGDHVWKVQWGVFLGNIPVRG